MCCNARRKIQAEGRVADLEAENARLQEQISRMIDGGSCPARDPNGECVELNEAISERDGYKAQAERRGEALVRTGKWERLPDGHLICRVCCTGMRCECGPGEHVPREGCPNCLGYSGAALAATPNEADVRD